MGQNVRLWRVIQMTMLLILLALVEFGCDQSKRATETVVPSRRSAIIVEPPVVDLGRVEPKQPNLTARFRLSNRSSRPVRIMSIETSCGCTVGSVDRKLIPPGEDAVLSARIESRLNGPKQATLRIRTDASEEACSVVVQWITNESITVFPKELNFGSVLVGTLPVAETLKVTANDDISRDETWRSRIEISDNSNGAISSEQSDDAGSVNYKVTLRETDLRGSGRASIVIRYDESTFVAVPVYWEIVDPIRTVPESDFVGTKDSGAAWTSTLLVRAFSNDIFGVRLLNQPNEDLQIVHVNSRAVQCRLTGRAPKTAGAFKVEVMLTVDHGGQSTELPFVVHGFVE